MSRGEEKAAVNVEALRRALRERIGQRRAGGNSVLPAEDTTPWYKLAGDLAGVGRATVKKMLDGEPVTASVLLTVLDRLRLSAVDLVSLDDQCRLPQRAEAYAAFRHGYYIADLRASPGKPTRRWCREQVELRPGSAAGEAGGRLALEGTITNEFRKTFDVRALWVGPYLLTMTAFEREPVPVGHSHHTVMYAFTAVFNLFYPLKRLPAAAGSARPPAADAGQALCGFWHGLTCFGTPALYRFFLATRELAAAELDRLQKDLKAMTVLSADETAGG
jgi:hypothetical protein